MGEMFQNPAFFLGEEIVDSGFWYCMWCADSYLSESTDLDSQGFAIAADNAVGKGMRIHEKKLLIYGDRVNEGSLYLQINKKDSR